MLQSYENFYYNPSGFVANYERNWGWRHSVCYLLTIILLSLSIKLAKKQKRKHLCNIICAYSFGICARVKHRSKNAFKIAWNVLVLVFDMHCQRPGNLEGFIKTKVQSSACARAGPHIFCWCSAESFTCSGVDVSSSCLNDRFNKRPSSAGLYPAPDVFIPARPLAAVITPPRCH